MTSRLGDSLVRPTHIALTALALAACTGPTDGLNDEERAFVHTMALPGLPPPDPSNAVLPLGDAGVHLGQQLFFDPDISGPLVASQAGQPSPLNPDGGMGPGQVACADCHSPNRFFSDDRSVPNNVSLGPAWTSRNSPPLVDVAFYQGGIGNSWFAWDGRSDSLWMQCDVAYEAKPAMNGSRLQLARTLWFKYRDEYNALFPNAPLDPALDPSSPNSGFFMGPNPPGQPELDLVTANASKLLASYLTQLVSNDSPFDRFALGDETALNTQQLRGLKLFLGKAGCVDCHSGGGLTDLKFHNTGVPQEGPQVPETDDGRFVGLGKLFGQPYNQAGAYSDLDPAVKGMLVATGYPGAPTAANKGQFRTKSLRNVSQTGPYMHAGQLETLADVVRFYNVGGGNAGFSGMKDILMQPLGLSDAEIDDLVSFLETLTGSPPADPLRCDPSPRTPGSRHPFQACTP